jgi:hypothetical protein
MIPMQDLVLLNRKERKVNVDRARDQEERGQLLQRCNTSENTPIIQELRCIAGVTKLTKNDLLKYATELATLTGLSGPGRQHKRRRDIIIGWINDHQDQFMPFLLHLPRGSTQIQDDGGFWIDWNALDETNREFNQWEQ